MTGRIGMHVVEHETARPSPIPIVKCAEEVDRRHVPGILEDIDAPNVFILDGRVHQARIAQGDDRDDVLLAGFGDQAANAVRVLLEHLYVQI